MNLKDLVFSACGLSNAHRPIRLRLSCTNNVLNDQLLVQRVIGSESLCGGIEYRLLCLSTNAYLPLKQFIAQPVELQFVTDTGGLRSVCGIVAQACAGQSDGGLASYQLLVRDALALMDRRSNTRVFRNRNEIDIAQIILDEWRRTNPILGQAFDVDYSKVKASYPAREFTLQHNESDAAFLRRLCKRRGIAWFIHPSIGPHSTPAHTLVLFDRADLLQKNAAGTVRYHGDSATEQRDSITSWTPVRTLQPGSIARQSWDYMSRPMGSELSSRIDQGEAGNRFAASLEDYLIDTPHAGDSGADYSQLGELRILRHELESKCFYGEGTVRDLCVGQWNGLQGHPEIDTHPQEEREFIITELQVEAQNNLPKVINEQVQRLFARNRWQAVPHLDDVPINSKSSLRYHNRFACVRRTVPLVPAFDARVDLPRPQLQSATVVGPPGEEVHCDAYGRVKVQIHGLRSPDQQQNQQQEAYAMDSAWVRVCSTWSGNQWGAMSLPRVGDEVIIDFLGGDPDKPIIIASVFSANALPPIFSHTGQLPGNKYLAGIKSKEVQGSRYNQLRFDDTPEQINAQLASEHCHSQLNLGWLTHPRHNGQGQARGEGAELRSDGAVVMRAAKLMLLTTQAMLQAQGEQLERGPLQTLLDNSHSLLKALGEYAQQHAALPIEQEAHQNINRALKNAEQSSDEAQNSAALIASYAAGGFASATPYSSVSYSGQHQHLIAQQHSQILAGGRLSLQAAQGISQFAQHNGIKHIAHHGKFDIQAQHDSIGIAAESDVKITANQGEVIVAAQKSITLICGGAYIKIGDGKIEHGCTGNFTVKAGMHSWEGPASASQEMQKFSEGKIDFNDFFQVRDSAGELLANKKYAIERADGCILRGSTDAQGRIELQKNLLTEAIQIKMLGDDV